MWWSLYACTVLTLYWCVLQRSELTCCRHACCQHFQWTVKLAVVVWYFVRFDLFLPSLKALESLGAWLRTTLRVLRHKTSTAWAISRFCELITSHHFSAQAVIVHPPQISSRQPNFKCELFSSIVGQVKPCCLGQGFYVNSSHPHSENNDFGGLQSLLDLYASWAPCVTTSNRIFYFVYAATWVETLWLAWIFLLLLHFKPWNHC
jgi:hypothetical protein